MKHLILMLAACALLAGCQTDAQVRSKPPLQTFASSKSADAAVTCLIPALSQSWNAAAIQNSRFVAQTIAPGSEYDIVPSGAMINGHWTFTVNVKASGSRSAISLYQGQMMLPSLTQAMKNGIMACL
ncbi:MULTISPECIES: hypothetical protein [Rhizobium]|uniref:Lipoprotein n=1 Tax=Rhizobium laguerreae TaxID=1076926 RepID=A0A7Y2RBF0_9HYPH|nr:MULTISPECIES: hypothetical protein [Rhizobium]MBY5442731.1 hypothetical protein [Rhizobium leguminosarum]NNH67525.1 hypothetical protein [Rhizobium laguerreae]